MSEGFNKDVFWSGREHGFDPTYMGEVWGVRGQGKIPQLQARTYAIEDSGVLPLISEDVPLTEYNVHGDPWYKLWGEKVLTNDVVRRDFSEGSKRVHIDMVWDPGPNTVPMASAYRTGDKMLDYDLLNIPQNDVVVAPNVIRKSLIGNNGDFSKNVRNAFCSFLPVVPGYFINKRDE